jgi:DNA topoisomerase-1
VLDALNDALGDHIFPQREDGGDARACPSCADGRLSIRLGKFGAFIGCSNHPTCKYTRPVAPPDSENALGGDGVALGAHPETGEAIALKTGRFGPYVQLGEGEKPKRASLPRGWTPETTDLARALRLLSLPRDIGPHPEDGEMVIANIGKYGPYVQKGKSYANLAQVEDTFEIQMNRAVALLAERAEGGKGRFGRAPKPPLKELGESPVTGKPVVVREGRFGPFITDGETIANMPKAVAPADMTLDIALPILAKKAETAPTRGKKRSAPTKKAVPATDAKKPAAKKAKAITDKPKKRATPAAQAKPKAKAKTPTAKASAKKAKKS